MEPLKEMFNKYFFEELGREFEKHDRYFNTKSFLKEMLRDLDPLSLNERMRKTSVVLKEHLGDDFKKNVKLMYKVIPGMRRGYTNLLFPDFVGLYGHNDIDLSLEALKYFTGFGSSEFAIREFLKRDFKKTIQTMHAWSEDGDYHVRRLASEGSRPRLPWSFKLDEVISNPSSTRQILENLRSDEELYVRKSVANHLNDISKDQPDFMLGLVKQWDQSHPHTAWIIKHASRSLIKKGNPNSLAIFNFEKNVKIEITNFKISAKKLRLGETLTFSFDLISQKAAKQKLVIDYIIHYSKKSGELSPKVFKLTEIDLEGRKKVTVSKRQIFKDFTTRKHFSGEHILEIQVNGKVAATESFHLFV